MCEINECISFQENKQKVRDYSEKVDISITPIPYIVYLKCNIFYKF